MNAQQSKGTRFLFALATAYATAVSAAATPPPQEASPVHDRTIMAQVPQANARFGYTMAGGKVESTSDTMDDLAVCAISEDEGSLQDVSAIWLYLNSNLDPATGAKARLLPKQPYNLSSDPNQPGIQMGNLETLIGNPRGSGQSNLVIAGASPRRITYPNSHGPVNNAGSVEVFDINAGGFSGHAQLSLIAPVNPGTPPTNPVEVQGFGHGLALGDVTEDGIDDLAVGAMDTETSWGAFNGNAFGRLYLFQGHSGFLSSPHQTWVGINAPQPQFDSTPDTQHHLGTGFGAAIVAVDFDADGKTELVVGRPNRYDRRPFNSGVYESGSAWIFRGSYLATLLSGSSSGSVINPPHWPYELDTPPEYQVLLDPFHEQTPDSDWFGWTIFSIGDMGSHDGGPPDGFPDIAIHSEDTDFIGNGEVCQPCIDAEAPVGDPSAQVCKVGGLFIYFGVDPEGSWSPLHFVYTAHVLLQPPSNLGLPQPFARFGRAASGIQLHQVIDDEPVGVGPGLLVASLEKDTSQGTATGHVMLFRPPFCSVAPLSVCEDPLDPYGEFRPVDTPNAWEAGSLLQPQPTLHVGLNTQVANDQYFGSDIVALDYKGNQLLYPGQQFVVSSRQGKVVEIAADGQTVSATYSFAGSAFSFIPAGTSP